MTSEITIARRFRGPTESGNGGHCCGMLARGLPGVVEVTLRAPPPLDRPLRVDGDNPRRMLDGDTVIAEARPLAAVLELELPTPPSLEDATLASVHYIGHHGHPFPECFVCGPRRTPGDGLCIFPGRLHADDPIARAPWVPDPSLDRGDGTVDPVHLWAALDCPGYFGFGQRPQRCVLGRMAATVRGGLPVGARCIATGWSLGAQGRKRFAGSAVFDEHGREWGRSRQVWIVLDDDA